MFRGSTMSFSWKRLALPAGGGHTAGLSERNATPHSPAHRFGSLTCPATAGCILIGILRSENEVPGRAIFRGESIMSRITTALALIFLSASAVFGQAVAIGSVSGTVSDQSGSFVPGATVNMTETDKGTVHTVTTTADGRYTFNNLPTGPYRLDAQAKGFKNYVQTGIVLQVAENLTQNIALQVGALTETVEVQAGASMVETRDSSISSVIETQRIMDLPLNGRNLTSLLMMSGVATNTMNVNSGDLTGNKNMGGSNGSGQFSVAGGAANGLNYLLDGGDNNDAFSNVNLPIPFPDAVQEFSVQTNGLPAQYG